MTHWDDVTKVRVIFFGFLSTSYTAATSQQECLTRKQNLWGKTVNLWLREGLFDVHQYII